MKFLKSLTLITALVALTFAAPALAAGGKGSTASNGMLNHVFRTTSYTAPTNVYVGLMSVCPTTGNNGTELSGNGYTRSGGIAKGDASWTYTAATFIGASAIVNAASISFPAASTSAWTVNCFGVYDASSGGNLLYWGPLTGAPITVSVGATASFAIGQLSITEARISPKTLEELLEGGATAANGTMFPCHTPSLVSLPTRCDFSSGRVECRAGNVIRIDLRQAFDGDVAFSMRKAG
jgi:hypothetical protein